MQSNLRPRDRLLRHGAAGLTDAELLAVLLRYRSAEKAAERLLSAAGGLRGLLRAARPVLCRNGATEGRAAVVLAAGELMRRLAEHQLDRRRLLDQPIALAEYVAMKYSELGQEVLGAIYLDCRHRLIAEREIFRGTATRAAAEPGPILREALQHHAAKLIIFHTHPSGDPSPSNEDLLFTERMAKASELIGVKLVDHLIVGALGRWVSLSRRGSW